MIWSTQFLRLRYRRSLNISFGPLSFQWYGGVKGRDRIKFPVNSYRDQNFGSINTVGKKKTINIFAEYSIYYFLKIITGEILAGGWNQSFNLSAAHPVSYLLIGGPCWGQTTFRLARSNYSWAAGCDIFTEETMPMIICTVKSCIARASSSKYTDLCL